MCVRVFVCVCVRVCICKKYLYLDFCHSRVHSDFQRIQGTLKIATYELYFNDHLRIDYNI